MPSWSEFNWEDQIVPGRVWHTIKIGEPYLERSSNTILHYFGDFYIEGLKLNRRNV
jgi:hypothetical protein